MDLGSPTILDHELDPLMLDQIDTLRTIRLNLAETMLSDLPRTSEELVYRGLVHSAAEVDEIRKELLLKIDLLRSRIQNPRVIYADELDLYLHLLESTGMPQASECIDRRLS